MGNTMNLVVYGTEGACISYYDDVWALYAVQVKEQFRIKFLIVGYQGTKKDDAALDWLPMNWYLL